MAKYATLAVVAAVMLNNMVEGAAGIHHNHHHATTSPARYSNHVTTKSISSKLQRLIDEHHKSSASKENQDNDDVQKTTKIKLHDNPSSSDTDQQYSYHHSKPKLSSRPMEPGQSMLYFPQPSSPSSPSTLQPTPHTPSTTLILQKETPRVITLDEDDDDNDDNEVQGVVLKFLSNFNPFKPAIAHAATTANVVYHVPQGEDSEEQFYSSQYNLMDEENDDEEVEQKIKTKKMKFLKFPFRQQTNISRGVNYHVVNEESDDLAFDSSDFKDIWLWDGLDLNKYNTHNDYRYAYASESQP